MLASRQTDSDVIIVGGGMVGTAVALGLARLGQRVTVLDGPDTAIRAARANFGLVWVQGKGAEMHPYATLTRRAADAWQDFAAGLQAETGLDVEYRASGGLVYCVGDIDFEKRRAYVSELAANGVDQGTVMIDRSELERMQPQARFGSEVVGASWCAVGGESNPLRLLRAMRLALGRLGSIFVSGVTVSGIDVPDDVRIGTDRGEFRAGKVVIAAGLGTTELARRVGLDVSVTPERGNLIVTERTGHALDSPGGGLRQAVNGTFLIGSSSDRVGMNDSVDPSQCVTFVRRALKVLPGLDRVNIVRMWAGLRTMTPDGCPIYATAAGGRIVAIGCHSAITLAPIHARDLPAAIAAGTVGREFGAFATERFKRAAA